MPRWLFNGTAYRPIVDGAIGAPVSGDSGGGSSVPRVTNDTYDSRNTMGSIPYKQNRGSLFIADTKYLSGPNGSRRTVTWNGHRKSITAETRIDSAYRITSMTPTDRALRINAGLSTITATVTDSEGGTRTFTQDVLSPGVHIDPFYNSKLNGDGRWIYQPYAGTAMTRKIQIAVEVPANLGKAIVKVNQIKGGAVALSQSTWEVTDGSRMCYCEFEIQVEAGRPNMELLAFRAQYTIPSRPDLGTAWSDVYYVQLIRNTTPLARQTMPDIYPASHWCHVEARRVPLARTTDGWTETTDGLVVTPQDSSVYVNELFRQSPVIGMTTDKYAGSLWLADASTPQVEVLWDDGQNLGWDEDRPTWRGVPFPSEAIPSNGTDGHVGIYRTDTDQWWEFWQFRHDIETGKFMAVTGGRVDNFSKKQGQNKENRNQWPFFTVSASGLALYPTVLKAHEVIAALRDYDPNNEAAWDGHINHVLNVGLPQAKKFGICWPATSTDGTHNRVEAPWEGQRFSIDQSLDLRTLGLSRGSHIIARAMQKYGFLTSETAGSVSIGCQSAHAWRLAQDADRKDPYAPLWTGPDGGYDYAGKTLPWDMVSKVPKESFRAHRIFRDQAEFYALLL